jgi:hypothetical protein
VELYLARLMHLAMMPPNPAFVSLKTVQMRSNGSMFDVEAASSIDSTRTPTRGDLTAAWVVLDRYF